MVLITPMLAMQIAGFATKMGAEALKESDPQVAKNLALLSKLVNVGTQTAGQIGKAGASPNTGTGLGIADSKISEAFKKMPEGIFGGALKEGATFGEGINKLPESIGGAFKSPSWNAPESIFNFNPGETKPFDWSLFK